MFFTGRHIFFQISSARSCGRGPHLNELGSDGDGDLRRRFSADIQTNGRCHQVQQFLRQAIVLFQRLPHTGRFLAAADDTHITRPMGQNLGLDCRIIGMAAGQDADVILGTQCDIVIHVAVEDEKFAELKEKYGFYTQQAVPAGTYNGMEEDVMTVAVMATYIVDKDLPEKAVYDLTKAMFENKDAIAAAHVKGAELNAETAIDGIPAEVPLHPGAAKYYKEIGVLAE